MQELVSLEALVLVHLECKVEPLVLVVASVLQEALALEVEVKVALVAMLME